MCKEWNLSIHPEPYWLLEAMACMNYVHTLDSEEWLNRSGSWNRRQKEEFLVPYRSYRGAMRTRLQPVFEQYPMLRGYVDASPRKYERENLRSYDSPMIAFLIQMQDVLEAEEMPGEKELEESLNQAFGRMLGNDLQKSPDTEEIVISGLTDIMSALEGWDGEDADKFKMLRLYSERREIMEQLWSLREPCREIGCECLGMLRERFDACMEKARNPEKLAALLDGAGLRCEEGCDVWIVPGVMRYDMIMLQATESTTSTEKPESIKAASTEEPESIKAASTEEPGSIKAASTEEPESIKAASTEEPGSIKAASTEEPGSIKAAGTEETKKTKAPSETAEITAGAGLMKLKIHLGIETFYMFESKEEDYYNDDRLISGLKALGDATRLKILHQLIERPCYLQEMAKALELTPATVLHHLGILVTEDLIEIQVTKGKKKVYYQVKKQGLEEISRGIAQLALTRQEREDRQREQQKQQLREGRQKQGAWQWTIQK